MNEQLYPCRCFVHAPTLQFHLHASNKKDSLHLLHDCCTAFKRSMTIEHVMRLPYLSYLMRSRHDQHGSKPNSYSIDFFYDKIWWASDFEQYWNGPHWWIYSIRGSENYFSPTLRGSGSCSSLDWSNVKHVVWLLYLFIFFFFYSRALAWSIFQWP